MVCNDLLIFHFLLFFLHKPKMVSATNIHAADAKKQPPMAILPQSTMRSADSVIKAPEVVNSLELALWELVLFFIVRLFLFGNTHNFVQLSALNEHHLSHKNLPQAVGDFFFRKNHRPSLRTEHTDTKGIYPHLLKQHRGFLLGLN